MDYSTEALKKKTMAQLKEIAAEVGAFKPKRYPNRKMSWIEQIQAAIATVPQIKKPNATDVYLLGREFTLKIIDGDLLFEESDQEKAIRELKKPILEQMAGATREEKDKLSDQVFHLNRQLHAASEAREKAIKRMFNKLLKALKNQSGISTETARELALQPHIWGSVPKRTQNKIRKDLAEFYELTGGRGAKSIKGFGYFGDRAYATPEGLINIGMLPTKTVIFHEMSHHAEFESASLAEITVQWRSYQATGKPQRLIDITGNSDQYNADEMAYPGTFFHPYLGKIYPDENGRQYSTEILSMGVQHFSSIDAMRSLYKKDRAFFHFIVGVLIARI